jgi:flavin-binding protein dodecin
MDGGQHGVPIDGVVGVLSVRGEDDVLGASLKSNADAVDHALTAALGEATLVRSARVVESRDLVAEEDFGAYGVQAVSDADRA